MKEGKDIFTNLQTLINDKRFVFLVKSQFCRTWICNERRLTVRFRSARFGAMCGYDLHDFCAILIAWFRSVGFEPCTVLISAVFNDVCQCARFRRDTTPRE